MRPRSLAAAARVCSWTPSRCWAAPLPTAGLRLPQPLLGDFADKFDFPLFEQFILQAVGCGALAGFGQNIGHGAYSIILQLRYLQKSDSAAPITVYINSPRPVCFARIPAVICRVSIRFLLKLSMVRALPFIPVVSGS